MFKTKNAEQLSVEQINLIISNIIFEVIDNSTPHKWIPGEEPFVNKYTGRISRDYSGEVVRISSMNDVKSFIDDYKPDNPMGICSKLDAMLDGLYINEWRATYTSNYGKNWLSFKELIQERYNEWKYENFTIWDENGDYFIDNGIDMETVDIELDGIFQEFLATTAIDLYYKRICRKVVSI